MTVLPHPVAPGQDDAFVAKALQVRSRNPAGCDKIAQESKPLRSSAAADAVHLAIDRPVFLFDRGIAVCLRTGDICASRTRPHRAARGRLISRRKKAAKAAKGTPTRGPFVTRNVIVTLDREPPE
jgi:hypothetical protein